MLELTWRNSLKVGDAVAIHEHGFAPFLGEVAKSTKRHVWVDGMRFRNLRFCRADGIESGAQGAYNKIGGKRIRKPPPVGKSPTGG